MCSNYRARLSHRCSTLTAMTHNSTVYPVSAPHSADIAARHPLALADLRTIIHHPRSLARPSAAWRPPVKTLPAPRSGPKLRAAVTRRRVGPRARARIQGWGEEREPAYLVELRISDESGAPTDRGVAEAWVRAVVTDAYAGTVHEIPSARAATYVWLVDRSYRPVYSPPSMFDGMTAA